MTKDDGRSPPSEGRALTAHIWSGHFTRQEGNPAFCRASVPDGGRSLLSHQCNRKPFVFRECAEPRGIFGFCRLHDPLTVAEKRAAKEAQWRAEWDAEHARAKLAQDRKLAMERCIAALREIEAGRNDPQSLARDALADLDASAGETGTAET